VPSNDANTIQQPLPDGHFSIVEQLAVLVDQQQRLMELSAAVSANQELDVVLKLVRDAVIEAGRVDRVGVFIKDGEHLRGTFGTDESGHATDERDVLLVIDELIPAMREMVLSKTTYAISELPEPPVMPNGEIRTRVPNAGLTLIAGGELLGVVFVDTLFTLKPITEQNLKPLIPFIHQAAVAIQNAHLFRRVKAELQEREKAEAALREQAIELLHVRDAALAGTRAKSEFLANMSHEIRTPMNGVMGMAELLLGTSLSEQQRDYARIIYGSAESLLNVINDILDFSKIEAGKLALEVHEFNLRLVLEEAAGLLAPGAQERGLELNCDIPSDMPENFKGDSARLRQIVMNFLGNAIKFTSKGEICIEAKCLREGRKHAVVRIAVTDTGVGIREDRLDAVFESFTQEDGSTTRRYGGTGLGLTISRQLATMMNGRIGVESKYGVGSTFWVELDLVKSAVLQASPTSIVDLVGKRVLIVDDNATNRHILRDQMLSWGCNPYEARTGPAALRMAGQDVYDLVLMDLQMPNMDGYETTRRLRSIPAYQEIPVVLLSSACWQNSAFAVEFDSVLSKPVRQSHLLETVIQLFSTHPAAQRTASAPATGSDAGLPSGLRVLVAEDNRVNQLVVTHLLTKWKCQVTIAETGIEAISHLEKQEFDLVLMDVQMPEMDGFEATKIIRQRMRTRRYIPIIATTAHAMEGDRDRCLSAGMDDYVTKPVKADELLRKLQRWALEPTELAA